MHKPVEQSSRHFSFAKYLSSLTEAEIGFYDDACAVIELAQKVEQQRATGGAERQVTEWYCQVVC